ncbi:transporter [Actinomyces radicidentis]|uniref:Transporter n=1 Tax=Actinomyces radicidentis TaxID=111015 RepID=A0A0X8JCT6_ACTRD|nr:RDD family protein [Actinomyces radicidentis]AMD86514.1 transporter [Actinomyces radicidentis]
MVSEPVSSSERMIEQDRVVTGEAVALDIVPATLGNRMVSGVIDYGLTAVGLALSLLTWATVLPRQSTAAEMTQASLIVSLWLVVLPLAVETLSRGRSAGRLVVGTRVVRDDGGAVRLRHCLVRALVAVIEVWTTSGVLAVCSCAVTRRGKRLGDLLAGTYEVRERDGAQSAPPLLMPPELAAWAAQADMGALPGGLAMAARTFLQRASSTRPEARARLAAQLADAVAPYVAPAPPAGTHPERFLAAVLVERRDRELSREMRDRELDEAAATRALRPRYGV